ncbi:MAG: nucleotidyltransferase domain-containing protein, partial [Corynebacterium sp.]|nr:nucleotidyltransferase domain-containing protein [Corynebacterium sp.]
MNPQQLRTQAAQAAYQVVNSLELPAGVALAATGSFARGEMTQFSDLDLIL